MIPPTAILLLTRIANTTSPAEFIIAFNAFHVFAATGLVNQDTTTRALFCPKDLLQIIPNFIKGERIWYLKLVNPGLLALITLKGF
jgi:hypothetical protein